MKYTVEILIQIWDDNSGCRLEVGPDRDGLDLVEIRGYSDDGKLSTSITMTQESALLLAQAINTLYGKKLRRFNLEDILAKLGDSAVTSNSNVKDDEP